MTKIGYTHIEALIDRSGSMTDIKEDAEGGFNSFLEDQKKAPGVATISLTIFDYRIDHIYEMIPIQDAPPFELQPRATTAMLDAIGTTVQRLGRILAAMAEEDRPEKVVFLINTDGQENASREYNYDQICSMIKEQTETYSWAFLFLAANQDAVMSGAQIGIATGQSLSYVANSRGTRSSYGATSRAISEYRAPGVYTCTFSNADRDAAMGSVPDPDDQT